jgi:uncharacterized protein YozE (UPF0346 family)
VATYFWDVLIEVMLEFPLINADISSASEYLDLTKQNSENIIDFDEIFELQL